MNFRPEDKTGIIIFTNAYDSTQYLGPVTSLAFKLIKNVLFRMVDRLAKN